MDSLFARFYEELSSQAHRQRRRWGSDFTLDTSALVAETFLKCRKNGCRFESRSHLLCVAAKAMHQVLLDYAKRRKALKRPPANRRVPLDGLADHEQPFDIDEPTADRILLADRIVTRLEQHNSDWAEVVRLRIFGSYTIDETSEAIKKSPATVKRWWQLALAWCGQQEDLSLEDL